jgi:nucleoside-diphosphate-sugar epimerase
MSAPGRVFVAGASGVVGRVLCRLLMRDGWAVVGGTRSHAGCDALRALGVEPAMADVFDEAALRHAVASSGARFIVHQLTDLPDRRDPARMAEALARNARIRGEGTRNLVAAAAAAGVERVVAQSIAFAYAPGPAPSTEDRPLDLEADDPAGMTARAVAALERQVLDGPFVGVVLRYGRFYGPGTWFDEPPPAPSVHVDAAADAARRALAPGVRGLYNIADDHETVSTARARLELGWEPRFRVC